MNRLDYLDFDMRFEKSGEEYVARVLNSPAGQAVSHFNLPFKPLEVENLLLRVGRTRRGVRRLGSPETEMTRSFGSALFSAVFDDEVLGCLRSSLNESYRRGLGLRMRLRFSSTPELGDLPWEFLFDSTRNQFLVLSAETPMVRYLELPQEVEPLAIRPPLKLLVMIASPLDHMPLDVEHEWDKLKEALGDLENLGLVSLTRLETASLASLQRQLRRDAYHIFHFIGHGAFDKGAQDGVLLTENETGHGRPVSGYDLGTLLHDHRSLRLAVLNACEGARSSLSDPFAGVAQSLVQQGIPAVIAMQFEITDGAAITMAHEFYAALADGFPVDGALAEARKAIFAQGNDVEWATPVLYLRAPDGVIFQIAPSLPQTAPRRESPQSTSAAAHAEAARLYTQGLSAYWLDEWEQAVERFAAVLELQPDHAEAATRLEAARRYLGLDRLSKEAQEAEAAGDWLAAIAALEKLADQAPVYADATARLEAARKRKQVEDLYAEARQLKQAGEWQALVNVFEHLAQLDPSAPDPDGLLPEAQAKLEVQRRQAELEELFGKAVLAIDAGRWEEAARLLREVQARQPDDDQAARLLRRAEAELARQAAPAAPPETPAHAAGATRAAAQSAQASPGLPVTTAPQADRPQTSIREPLLSLTRRIRAGFSSPASRPVLLVGAGWFMASLFALLLPDSKIGNSIVDGICAASNCALSWDMSYLALILLIAGSLSGAAIWIGLRSGKIRLPARYAAALLAAWAAGYLFTLLFKPLDYVSARLVFSWFLAGLVGGLATAFILRRSVPEFDRRAFWWIALGWAVAVGLGEWLTQYVYFGGIYEMLDDTSVSTPFFISLFHGLEGLLGALVMFYLLSVRASKQAVTESSSAL